MARASQLGVRSGGAIRVYLSYREQSDAIGHVKCRFQVVPYYRLEVGCTYECDIRVVNGKLERVFFNYALADRRRIEDWVESSSLATQVTTEIQLSVSCESASSELRPAMLKICAG